MAAAASGLAAWQGVCKAVEVGNDMVQGGKGHDGLAAESEVEMITNDGLLLR